MIVICWEQLPIYAARSIGAFVESSSEEVVVLRVPTSRFPIKGAAEMTKTRVVDVAFNDERSLRQILGAMPDVFVCGGWGEKSFLRWMDEVHAATGKVIVCTDEPMRDRGWRERLRKWRFKWMLQRRIDRLFVAGQGGVLKFAGWYGFPPEKVVTGLYAGDPKLFYDGAALPGRDKRFIYVGHYDANKNVVAMCEAFRRASAKVGGDWSLDVYGGGPLESQLKQFEDANLRVHGYVNADQLGPMYREARCFVLGSHAEQWGVVVHEACLSGCLLLLSNHVGSRFDFAKEENSVLFDPNSTEDFARGFETIMRMTDEQQLLAQRKSVELGQQFSPQVFAQALADMVDDLRKRR